MAGDKTPPATEPEGPFAGPYAKGPAQRHCCGIARGLCLSAVFGSAWLYGQTLVPAQAVSLRQVVTRLLLQPHGAHQGET